MLSLECQALSKLNAMSLCRSKPCFWLRRRWPITAFRSSNCGCSFSFAPASECYPKPAQILGSLFDLPHTQHPNPAYLSVRSTKKIHATYTNPNSKLANCNINQSINSKKLLSRAEHTCILASFIELPLVRSIHEHEKQSSQLRCTQLCRIL